MVRQASIAAALCLIVGALYVSFALFPPLTPSMHRYGALSRKPWINWQRGYPTILMNNCKGKPASSCIAAVVGNGKLTDRYRAAIDNADVIIRINARNHIKKGERTDVLFLRERGEATATGELLFGRYEEGARKSIPCVIAIMNKDEEMKPKKKTPSERESAVTHSVLANSKDRKGIAMGIVRTEELSASTPEYAHTNFPETRCGPSSGYVAVVSSLELVRDICSNVHVYGITAEVSGTSCNRESPEKCDARMKAGKKTCHNQKRERELLSILQHDYPNIKIFWSPP